MNTITVGRSLNLALTFFIATLIIGSPSSGLAWGKRGHEAVGSLAAQLLGKEHKGSEFLIYHSFDMGYYNNVPDLVWKADPETYKKEYIQHFMDLEDYAKVKDVQFNKDRKQFFSKYPMIQKNAGRAWWRVQELVTELEKISQQLKRYQKAESGKKNPDKKMTEERHRLQAQWLLHAGVLGHYIADLAQPMHVTDNYDGEQTGQKGVHHWFEEEVIDHLYPDIKTEAYKKARDKWAAFHKENEKKAVFDLVQQLAKDSSSHVGELLKIDKKQGRSSGAAAASAFRDMATDRISVGILYLAEIWSRHTGWNYDGDRFYTFLVAPAYIEPSPEK